MTALAVSPAAFAWPSLFVLTLFGLNTPRLHPQSDALNLSPLPVLSEACPELCRRIEGLPRTDIPLPRFTKVRVSIHFISSLTVPIPLTTTGHTDIIVIEQMF